MYKNNQIMSDAKKPIIHGGNAEAVAERLGIGACPAVRLDFSVNVNPLGMPSWLNMLLCCSQDLVEKYPEAGAVRAEAALAKAHGTTADRVMAGNGATELFACAVQAFRPLQPVWLSPSYVGYREICSAAGLSGRPVVSGGPESDFKTDLDSLICAGSDMVFLASPGNPTGKLLEPAEVLDFCRKKPGTTVILDESFMDFVEDAGERTLTGRDIPDNLIVIKSLTKFFAIPGLRLGMAYAMPQTLAKLKKTRLPWSVNGIVQAASERFYSDKAYISATREEVKSLRGAFTAGLQKAGMKVYGSSGPFLLCRLPDGLTASGIQGDLLRMGILIRSCADYDGLGESYIRLAVRPRREQDELLSALEYLAGRALTIPKRVPAIMVVGTTSHSGKSLITAGLCRIFARAGVSVAPFKAQNMALNSFVTREGGEMGRAQVTQARAARIEPHTDMNPVLLKPSGENGSQVIVNGKATGNMTAREYYSVKKSMREQAHAAYDRISRKYDLMILEGAGSPSEINLRSEDFVNMDMAVTAGASAVLVADIDRGGVFASIMGTLALMPSEHRKLLKGIIINKFRGDKTLLDDVLKDIEHISGVKVLGVMPYLKNLHIEEEDSLGLEGRSHDGAVSVRIAVIRLPFISNYTDFLPLEVKPGVRLEYVTDPRGLTGVNLVIIPGSKNTRHDLQFLHDSGFAARIKEMHGQGVPVIGVCGGYQMMGGAVSDPHAVEGQSGSTPGLGLLPVFTELEPEKELAQVKGVICPGAGFAGSGATFSGYEIHAGRTAVTSPRTAPLSITERRGAVCDEEAGCCVSDGRTYAFGSYVHGLFDQPAICDSLLAWLKARSGISAGTTVMAEESRDMDREFDRLADAMEENLDIGTVRGWVK